MPCGKPGSTESKPTRAISNQFWKTKKSSAAKSQPSFSPRSDIDPQPWMLSRRELRPAFRTIQDVYDIGPWAFRHPVRWMHSRFVSEINSSETLPTAAGLEMTISGPTLRFNTDCTFCLTGAPMKADLEGAAIPFLDGHSGAAGTNAQDWTTHRKRRPSLLSSEGRPRRS